MAFPLLYFLLSGILFPGDRTTIPQPAALADIFIAYPPHSNDCIKEQVGLNNLPSDPLKVVVTANDYFLLGTYANSAMQLRSVTNQFDYPCEGTGCDGVNDDIWKYETVMCYYHLNYAFQFMDSYLDTLVEGYQTPQNIIFYAFNDGSNTAYGLEDAMYFGANCSPLATLKDYAQDADYIVGVAFETFFRANGFELPNTNDGVATGLLAYLTRIYMRTKGYDHSGIGAYGGTVPIIAVSTTNTGNYNSIAGETQKRARAKVWASALMEMSDALGEELFLKLLFTAMPAFEGGPGGNDQPEAALVLFNTALQMWAVGGLNQQQICTIQSILSTRYPDTYGFGFVDYYIKNTAADIGREPFSDNEPVWNSPSIWVRNAPDQGFGHQDAIYDPDNPQTVRIRVHNRACSPDSVAILELYFSIAEFGLDWAANWLDFYTEPNGMPVLSGDKIAEIPLPVFDSSSEAVVDIGWLPPNPQDFDQETLNVSLLARIVSAQDELNEVEGVDVTENVRKNNNIAWRAILVRAE